jgi:PEP-CTERM motif
MAVFDGLQHNANTGFVVLALGGAITEVDLLSTSGFAELKQFEVSGLASDVPEPATWAMMLFGFAGPGFAGYRRARQSRFAYAGL